MGEVVVTPFIPFLFLLLYLPANLHRQEIRQVEKEEVEKMMSCKGPDRGCFSRDLGFNVLHP